MKFISGNALYSTKQLIKKKNQLSRKHGCVFVIYNRYQAIFYFSVCKIVRTKMKKTICYFFLPKVQVIQIIPQQFYITYEASIKNRNNLTLYIIHFIHTNHMSNMWGPMG